MPLSQSEHLDDLIRHKERVKDAGILLGKRLIAEGRDELGKQVIARGYAHDLSKFEGIEWQFLHCGNDVDPNDLQQAMSHHWCQTQNRHHPEFHGGLKNMTELDVMEMICDFLARSQEFGTSLRDWISTQANVRFHIDECPAQKAWIDKTINLLLRDQFVRTKSA